jgi:hypothetical protein
MHPGQTALRVGVIQSGRLVEERVLHARSISVGRTAASTLILASEDAPRCWRLFERRGRRYRVRLSPAMEGRLAHEAGATLLAGRRTFDLPDRARGRVIVGDAVILFQVVTAPSVPRPQLPRSLRPSARDLDRPFAALAALSFLLHLGLVLYLRGVDWPRQPEPDEVPDVFVHTVLRRPAPAVAPAPPTVAQTPTVVRPPVHSHPTPSLDDQRRRLVAQVGRQGLLQVITALGDRGAVRDLLRNGSVDRAQEQAMREVGGLTVAQEGAPLPLGAGTPGGGRIADVSALQGGPHIRTADVGPAATERRVPLVRTEAPALDEPVAGFDPQRIGRAIRDRMAEVRACYERALKRHPELGGRLMLRFVLTPAGTVAGVEVDEDTLHDPDVAACVRNAVLHWRFPAPPQKVELSFPFIFQPVS